MIRQIIQNLIKKTGTETKITKPKSDFGDYAVFVRDDTAAVAESIKSQITNHKQISKIEVKGKYINFFLSKEFLQSELARMVIENCKLKIENLSGKTVIVEYTDPNPFKLFHIGHLMNNSIGEAIARLYEASGAKVWRVNYQGDVGLHVAKAIWVVQSEKRKAKNLGEAYAEGNRAYEQNPETKKEVEAINKKIYERNDEEINALYDQGKKASLDYFEKIYARLGTKFDHYFFESEMSPKGLEIIKKHPEVFSESDGAIVFRGAHTRVFVNSHGLPTYEAKELGLNREKFDLYNPNFSIIVTGNEIVEYFKVMMEAMKLVMPDVAAKTRHVPHGMIRLPTGKMSSRTGEVITAEELIEKVKEKVGQEEIAIGAIKYSILKQGIGRDIIFDFDKALAVNGDSGVYLQYTYARLKSILNNAPRPPLIYKRGSERELEHPLELNIIKHLIEFPKAVKDATERLAPNVVALYLYELANLANRYYEEVRILDDVDENRKNARLVLIQTTADLLQRGMEILGIKTLERV